MQIIKIIQYMCLISNDAFDNPKSDDADDEQKISASTAAATSAVINIDDDSVN
jgi:hypothetical protein